MTKKAAKHRAKQSAKDLASTQTRQAGRDLGSGTGTQIAGNESEVGLYFAVLKEGGTKRASGEDIEEILKTLGTSTKVEQVFEEIKGFTVSLNEKQYNTLKTNQKLLSIEKDRSISFVQPILSNGNNEEGNSESQAISLERYIVDRSSTAATNTTIYRDGLAKSGDILPYGVKGVWGGNDITDLGNAGSGSYAFVIDSGVLETTGDLSLNRSWSRSWISGENAFSDGNGHGTHVAGIIAALANGRGVVGVAPGAEIVSLKVFNSNGGGATYSTVIDAVNYAAKVINDNQLDKTKCVINLSLGGSYSLGLDQAIKNAANQGIQFTIAAGNNGMDVDAFSPASAGDHPYVYTVSAVDNGYRMASFSNWDDSYLGDDVDLSAPGVGVYSYYKGGKLEYLSGTSMAAPHVAGLLLMGGIRSGSVTTAIRGRYGDPFAVTSLREIGDGNNINTSALSFLGGSANDTFYGRLGNDLLSGGEGNDILNGGGGQDTAIFGSGNNRVNLNNTDFQNTGEGIDRLVSIENCFAGAGNDVLIGNGIENMLYGEDGNDTIDGQTGNDTILGGNGDDWLIGGGGLDQITGGAGKDVFEVRFGHGYDLITDFKRGEDRIFLGSGVSSLAATVQDSNYLLYQQGDLLAMITGISSQLIRSGSYLI